MRRAAVAVAFVVASLVLAGCLAAGLEYAEILRLPFWVVGIYFGGIFPNAFLLVALHMSSGQHGESAGQFYSYSPRWLSWLLAAFFLVAWALMFSHGSVSFSPTDWPELGHTTRSVVLFFSAFFWSVSLPTLVAVSRREAA